MSDVFLIRTAIEGAGIEADLHVVQDGHEATRFVDRIESGEMPCPDLVLLDLNLPKKSGNEVLRHMRETHKCGPIPTLVITSSNSVQDRKTMFDLGAKGYFRKPSDFEEFMQLGPIVKALLTKADPVPTDPGA